MERIYKGFYMRFGNKEDVIEEFNKLEQEKGGYMVSRYWSQQSHVRPSRVF